MKVLIISHNPMSTKHSIGKTLLSLFSTFQKEELCQLYIHTGKPERDVCSSFFRVTDKDVLRGVLTRRVRGGEVSPEPIIVKTETAAPSAFHKSTYGSAKNRQPHRELLRDTMWWMSPWYNRALKEWIARENPTCIFAAIGSSKFLYDMTLKISKDFHLPIVTYVCDDFYTIKTPRTLLGPLWKKKIVAKTKKLLSASGAIVSICDEMSELYRKEFNRPTYTVMTGTNFSVAKEPTDRETIGILRYFGKVSLNRYLSIAEICRALDAMNEADGTSYGVEIYCDEPDEEVKNEFKDIRCARFCGFLSGDAFREAFFASEALLHVEAFDECSIDRVKHSVSTKIADTMASGIPLFAYGPDSVASIRHIMRTGGGIVATEANELEVKLRELFCQREKRLDASQRELAAAAKFHDPQKASDHIYQILQKSME